MKPTRLICLAILPFLFACFPKKPDIPMTEAPSGPVLQTLEQHRRSFSTLKAVGSIRVARKDRKRSFENVGILLNDRSQFRLEAYGPLGQTLITVVWDGKDMLLEAAGERRMMQPGNSGLERILGAEVDPADLSAILSGNIPGILDGPRSRMLCAANGSCILELSREGILVKVKPPLGWEPSLSIPSYEVYRGKTLVYRVIYEAFKEVSGYLLPTKINVENAVKRASLTVEYSDVEINVPLDDRSFVIPDKAGSDR